MKRIVRSAGLLLASCVVAAGSAWGQLSTSTLFGRITDATGAAIPSATVTLTQTQTGESRTLTTNDRGEYRAEFLPVGPYSADVKASGFSEYEQKGIVLTVTEEAKLDVTMKPGAESQTVEVTADIPLVNSGNSTLGRTVDNVEIDNLPLVDRNAYALLDLTPGVQNNNNAGQGGNGGVINPLGYPEQHVKINGSTDSTVGQVSYYLDGGSNMTGVRNTGNPLPNPDAIREFNVQTNNFSAQFGRSSGGVVTVLTKSGTNSFHGSAFEFYRTRNFNATPHLFSSKIPYNQQRFGFTLGGPVKKDKIFFFGSYAGFRFVSANTFNPQTPDLAQRNGDFSENLPQNNPNSTSKLAPNLDGTTTACSSSTSANASSQIFYACKPVSGTQTARTSYKGNIVPVSDLDPAIYRLMNAKNADGSYIIPLPNGGGYQRNDYSRYTQATDEYLGKGDIDLTGRQRLTLSYFQNKGNYVNNPSGNNVLNWVVHNYNFHQKNANVLHTWTLSNNTVNQLFVGYTRLIGGRVASPQESLAAYGSTFAEQLTDGSICPATGAGVGCSRPQIAVSGWFTAGNAITGPVSGNNVYSIRDVVSTTHGRHTMYIGGEADLEHDYLQTLLNNYGVFQFSQASSSSTTRTQVAITDLMFGRPASMGQDVPVYANATYMNYGAFFQDDFRMFPSLTLNLGIRYDVQTAPEDSMNRTLNFIPGQQSTIAPTAPVGVLFPGDPGVPKGGVATRYNHVSPRVGFAWTPFPDGRTVIHAGGGIFYGTVAGNLYMYPSNGMPFSGRPSFSKVISVADPYTTDPSEFCPNPGGTGCTVGVSPFPFTYDPKNPKFLVTPSSLITMDRNFHWPEIYQINAGVQQQFTKSFAVTMNYVASLGRKLPMDNDINYPVYNVGTLGTDPKNYSYYSNTTGNLNNRRPLNSMYGYTANAPRYSQILDIQSSESSDYNGLQVSAEQRLIHGFIIRGFWVWSKSLQSEPLDSSGNTGNSAATSPQDQNAKYLDRQRSDYDQRQVANISVIYKSDFGFKNTWARQIANGWTVTALWYIQSGNPVNITTGADDNQDGQTNDRPNPAAGVFPRVNDNGGSRVKMMGLNGAGPGWVSKNSFCAFDRTIGSNTACPQYGAGPGNSDGTFRANSLDGPGRRSVNASLFRDFQLHEQLRLQFRAEATNVFNLTNLPNPVATLTSSNFGQINGTITGGNFSNRVLQVGARVLF